MNITGQMFQAQIDKIKSARTESLLENVLADIAEAYRRKEFYVSTKVHDTNKIDWETLAFELKKIGFKHELLHTSTYSFIRITPIG